MGFQKKVPFQRTALFRQLVKYPELRPVTQNGQPQKTITAYCMMVCGLHQFQSHFIQLPETWSPPPTGDICQLVRDLIRHTFVRYPVPEWLYKAWEADDLTHKAWFIHLGAGKNLRKASHLPFEKPMTKMQAHYTCLAPSWMSIHQALRYGQIRSLGGNIKLAKIFAISPAGCYVDPAQDLFWIAAYRQLVKMQELSPQKIRAVITFWYQTFFEPQYTITPKGQAKLVVPPSDLNPLVKDCLPEVLTQLRPDPVVLGLSKIEIEALQNPFPQMKNSWKFKISNLRVLNNYEIVQLRFPKQLIDEGMRMNHCVGSYISDCRRGRCYIFSVRNSQKPFAQSSLTIEVSAGMRIVQVKGPANRRVTTQERAAILAWAKIAGLNPKCRDLDAEG